jgi:DNA topoisomerase-2
LKELKANKWMSCIPLFHCIITMASESLSSKYQKMTDLEHILKKPDTYIGSIQLTECTEYTTTMNSGISAATGTEVSIGLVTFTHIPALYKLVDEGLVNMRDHVIRQAQAIKDGKPNALPVTCIEVEVDAATGTITMTNDGNGIDIAQHPEHKMWIPEMIFGHLRTSTNYAEDKKEKIVGGKNGFGFKLVLVWSTWGSVETVDHVRGLKYTQEFKANLTEICAPKITKCSSKKPYTRISFRPDYARLGIAGLTPDMTALFTKRVYDIAAVTDRSIRVKYNGGIVPVKDFKQYIGLYIRPEVKRVYEAPNERWEYAVCLTNTDEFAHVSFVNGICTSKGGKHVEYVMGQLLRKLAAYIKTKKKVDVKPATIKEQLTLFLRCDVENPAFSSQTKDELTTTSANFGSACTVSDEFVEKVAKMGVMDAACALTEVKEAKAAKKTDGAKTRTIRGIPKLIDANFAGTEKSGQCTIIFCEGDSAKAGIVSGLSKEDRNTIGVYPVKGKFMNVRGEAVKRIAENTEIAEIKRILGLENGRDYTAEDVAKRLRYGKVLFMTDQDLDGSHIKGLGINLFQSEWPTLTHITGFIGFMNTPILKARKGAQERVFYNEGEFEAWKQGTSTSGGAGPVDVSTWNVKYYKGLGTSTGREFREYFEHKKIVDFAHTGEKSDDAVDLVFNKKRADDRKQWLSTYNRADHLDTSHKNVSYEDFMTREMKHFSVYDNQRSIANGMDGLKISLRKILFAAFKKGGLKTEIKVAQFSGYVSEHSGYHHGEASLNGAIVGMAQNFVGSNNINLFEPNGQFGTRLSGGKDSASERYIFTQLNAITRLIYRAEDDAVLEYLDDDGQLVEPTFYAPIVPMILVNGTKGIGTGFSTDIMCHNPLQIIDHIRNMLLKKPEAEWGPIEPYYRGFKGTITPLASATASTKFLVKGLHSVDAAKKQVRVTELPVGHWTEDFKKHLESLIETNLIKDYVDMSTDTVVDFTVTFPATADFGALAATVDHGSCTALEKLLKLYTTESTSNMHLFDSQDQLKKYGNVRDIVLDYYATRLALYGKRKTHQLAAMSAELLNLTNKARYIQELLDGSIDLRRKRGDELMAMLQSKGYDHVEGDEQYKYLLKLPMDSVSEENVQRLLKEKGQKEAQHHALQGTSIEQLWLADLAELRAEYVKQEEKRVAHDSKPVVAKTKVIKATVKAKPNPAKA